MKTEEILLRDGRDDVTLTTYVLDDSPEILKGRKRPAILVCPGGAYLNCSDREGEPVALRFAAMGYHAFVLRYSRYFGGKPVDFNFDGPISPIPERAHPAPVQDIGLAMKYLNERTEEWLLDTEKIAVCGFSAGSHNAAMYAVHWDKPLITDFLGASYRPAAQILSYGLSDYTGAAGAALVNAAPELERLVRIALYGTDTPDDVTTAACSPALLVSKDTPPAFIWATAADALVPVQQSIRMAGALADHGVPVEVHIFEEGQHGLSLADQSTAGSRSMIDADAAQWVGLAERWLEKRFALPIPDTAN